MLAIKSCVGGMPLIPSTPSPAWMTVMAVDAMLFHAAKEALKRAVVATRAIAKAETRVARHQAKIDLVRQRYEEGALDESVFYNRFEPLAIQMESLEYDVGAAYGPFLQHVATVHVFAAAALEAHVNIRAQELLEGRSLEVFDRFPLDAKWLFLPRLRGLPGFVVGAQPFQGLDRLIQTRNRLVHYRLRREPWRGSATPPKFLADLGLSLKAAEGSVATVREMAKELARQLGDPAPWWLDAENPSYFDIEQDRSR
jgi:hypothetical protein